MTECKICHNTSHSMGRFKVLDQYNVEYFQCTHCGFVQTESPYWLDQAYANPIAKSDGGLIARNIALARLASQLIFNVFNPQGNFLDYGSGYGMFIQLMRYLGLNFSGYDTYCQPIFSPDTVVQQFSGFYELVTAFEVLEHLTAPLPEIQKIFEHTDSLLFSTKLLPDNHPKPGEWYYYAPHEGQHIALYTAKSLQIIAQALNANLYTNSIEISLITRQTLPPSLIQSLGWETFDVWQDLKTVFFTAPLPHPLSPQPDENAIQTQPNALSVVVDGVFFQLYNTGISRVWASVLRAWADSGFGQSVTVLDRANTAPKYEGLSYRQINAYDYNNWQGDRTYLQQICTEVGATIFISSYYTTPLETPSVFMAYDMIPEVVGDDLDKPMWQAKRQAIEQACAAIGISANTIADLHQHFPAQAQRPATVAHCGVDPLFCPATSKEIASFRRHYGIQKPYFLLVAPSIGYKNAQLFFQAFAQWPSRAGFDLVCTSKHAWLDPQLRQWVPGTTIHVLKLTDAELRLAYAGAIALIYPSSYEGFGMPVVEALACGCPVITCPVSSLPEVGGDAVLYVQPDDLEEMMNALGEIQKPGLRRSLRVAGLRQAAQFTWAHTAAQIQQALIAATLPLADLQARNYLIAPDWAAEETVLTGAIAPLLRQLSQQAEPITLVIYAEETVQETADLLLSGIAFELMMNEGLDLEETLAFTFISALHPLQWSLLLTHLQGRLVLACEDERAIATLPDDLPIVAGV